MNDRIRQSLDSAFRMQSSALFSESVTGPGYVYLVKVHGFYKVGIAKNIKLRMVQMQVGCPYELDLVAQWHCTNPTAHEGRLHRLFHLWSVRGEWFALPDDIALRLSMTRHLHHFSMADDHEPFEAPTARYELI